MEICIDFDGTCVRHEYPEIGDDIGAAPVLKQLVKNGHKLILWTMRCDSGVELGLFTSGLTDAVNWFKDNDIPLYGIQRNPTQDSWTKSLKAYAQLYIDDAALGCPLIYPKTDSLGNPIVGLRPYVDWGKVEELLKQQNLIR